MLGNIRWKDASGSTQGSDTSSICEELEVFKREIAGYF